MTDLMEGITEKSTKAQLLDRLKVARDRLMQRQEEQASKVKEIEARIAGKYAATGVTLQRVVLLTTQQELDDLHDFLTDVEEICPVAALRILEGLRLLQEETKTT